MTNLLNRVRDRLSALLPEAPLDKPTISSYGQEESGIPMETVQQVMEWLFFSLLNAGYTKRSHLFWLHPNEDGPTLQRQILQLFETGEPMLGYRYGDRIPASPQGTYWRLMPEHNSLWVYQLEKRED